MLQVGMVVTWDLRALDLQCLLGCIACYESAAGRDYALPLIQSDLRPRLTVGTSRLTSPNYQRYSH